MSETVATATQWQWVSPASGGIATATGYPSGGPGIFTPTKSGLAPSDLEDYLGVPIVVGNPPTPVSPTVITKWLRWAEDDIETESNIRLCQTWIAAPAAKSSAAVSALQLQVKYNYQQLGVDYDYAEPAYDFEYERWRDEGWGFQRLRWRPVKGVEQVDPTGFIDNANFVGAKKVAFIYPLLNEYFNMPPTWEVEDQNRGLIRFVPATSVQMLPVFALQLAFLGFAQSVPGGLWFQYTAGLTANDYNSSWSFMRQLVLARAAKTAFIVMQTGLNQGLMETNTQIDGLGLRLRWSEKGAYAAQINIAEMEAARLMRRAKSAGGGIHLGIL